MALSQDQINAILEGTGTYDEAGSEGITEEEFAFFQDFSFFQKEIPGVFFFLGGMTVGEMEAYPHHTPDFFIDESGLLLGVKTFAQMSLDYLNK